MITPDAALLSLVVAAGLAAPGEEIAVLRTGERVSGVTVVALELVEAGACTLAAHGAPALKVVDAAGSVLVEDADGWVVLELPTGRYRVEVAGKATGISAVRGAHPGPAEVAPTGTLNRGLRLHGQGDMEAARDELLLFLAMPASAGHHALAEVFLADVRRREERFDEARTLLDGALEAAIASEPQAAGLALSCLGSVAVAQRDLPAARAAFERLRERASSPGEALLAACRLAQVTAAEGDLVRARAMHEDNLSRLDTQVAAYYAMEVRFAAARFFQERGELERATTLLELVVADAASWERQVVALGQLGVVLIAAGRIGRAQACFERVAALAAEHGPTPFDDEIAANQAVLAFELGDYGLAHATLRHLLEGSGLAPARRAALLGDLATVTSLQGDEASAEALFREALAAVAPDHPARWRSLAGLGLVLRRTGRLALAEASLQEAVAATKARQDAWAEATCLISLASVHRLLGDPARGREEAADAVETLRRQDVEGLLRPALHSLAANELALGHLDVVDALLDEAHELSARGEITARPTLQAARIRSRHSELSECGQLAVDLLVRRLAEPAAEPASLLAAGLPRIARWTERSLLSGITGEDDVPDDLTAALDQVRGNRRLVVYLAGTATLHAFVLDAQGPRLLALGPREPIEADVHTFLAGLADEGRLADAATVARQGRALYARLVEPLGPPAAGWIVVPTGELSRLSFEALVVDAAQDPQGFDELTFLLDRAEVAYAPSPAVLAALARRPGIGAPRPALLLGDARYAGEVPGPGAALALRSSEARSWPRLPRTRRELTSVARLLLLRDRPAGLDADLLGLAELETTRDGSLDSPAFALRLGADATVAALEELAPGAGLIHVAAHGAVDRWDPLRTGLVLAWDEERQGLLSLADIAGLRLDAALVVLSACRTADGRLLRGEGVQSMAQAFLLAGARGVVATLWPVEDVQSEQLMERFTRGLLLEGEDAVAALRAARLELRRGDPPRGETLRPRGSRAGHPHDWAPFVYTGAVTAPGRG